MGVFSIQIEIGNFEGTRFERFDALVDTGATYTMVPSSVLARLGVTPGWSRTFGLADGSIRDYDMAETKVRLDGVVATTLVVFGDEGAEPRVGAYTLESLGLSVDPVGQRLVELTGHL
jgi:predicted aspartyl protease